MKREAFVMCSIHSVLLNCSVELLQKLIHNGHVLVGILLVAYEQDGRGVEDVEEVEPCKIGEKVSRSSCSRELNGSNDKFKRSLLETDNDS